MDRKIPRTSKHMVARGRQLRHAPPVPERLLWARLRNAQCMGFKFRRQHLLGPYVADYYCVSAKIVVELDGRSHEGQGTPDEQRQKCFESQGLMVIRFTNNHVLTNLDGVVEAIAACCLAQPASAPKRTPFP